MPHTTRWLAPKRGFGNLLAKFMKSLQGTVLAVSSFLLASNVQLLQPCSASSSPSHAGHALCVQLFLLRTAVQVVGVGLVPKRGARRLPMAIQTHTPHSQICSR